MARTSRNPWLVPALVAGLSLAGAIALAWPSTAGKQGDTTAAGAEQPKVVAKKELCDRCESLRCADRLAACVDAAKAAAEKAMGGDPNAMVPDPPPPAEPALVAQCGAVLACVRETECAKDGIEACYCGKGVSVEDCAAGKAEGPCRSVIEANIGTKDPDQVAERYVHPKTGAGLAMRLVSCDALKCPDVCL